jgi:chemotaxis protein MotB
MRRLSRARAEAETEIDSEGSWAISYGDMITLLLTFFILFFSVDAKTTESRALQKALIAHLTPEQQKSPPVEGVASGEESPPQRAGGAHGIEQKIKDALGAQLHVVGERVIVEFPQVSFFDFGKTDLTQEGKQALSKFVSLYMPYAGTHLLGIRAYTDYKQVLQIPGRRFNDNLELSALRSVASMRTLQKAGIPLTRMRLGGYGELRLTREDLQRSLASQAKQGTPGLGLALARKIVLVIEPEPREPKEK